MKKRYIIIIVLVLGVIIPPCCVYFSDSVMDTFVGIDQKLTKAVDQKSEALTIRYFSLTDSLSKLQSPEDSSLLDSVENLYAHFVAADAFALSCRNALREKFARINPESGKILNPDETEKTQVFWLGTDKEANGQRGNGRAYALRNQIQTFTFHLNNFNQFVAGQCASYEYQQAELASFHKMGSDTLTWEQATFEGTLVTTLPVVQAIRMDVVDHMQQAFYNIAHCQETSTSP
ncbi:MAG: hypothetical protein AAGI38_05035 [Bacteroidota bacterium]